MALLGFRQFTKRIEQIEHKLSNLEKKTAPTPKEESQYSMLPGSGSSYKNYSQALSSTQNYSPAYDKPSPSTTTGISAPPPRQQTTAPLPETAEKEKKIVNEVVESREPIRENVPVRDVRDSASNNVPTETDPELLQLEKEKRERRERMERIERLIAREQGVNTPAPQPEVSQPTPFTAPPTPVGANTAAKTGSNISPEKVPGPFRSLIESTA